MSAPVVVVGAGLSALRTAESLRKNGYDGPIRVLGEEPHLPYNRPPLSKQVLAGGIEVEELAFPMRASVSDVDWNLGVEVVRSDLAAGILTTADNRTIPMSALVVASGIRPRQLPIPGPQKGRLLLRTIEDALHVRGRMSAGIRLGILGSGFIGCEVAATARGLGCEVDIVSLDSEPMIRPLGPDLGAGMRTHHEQHGVRFHLGRTISQFTGDDQVTGAILDDGTHLETDLMIEAVGSVANTEWLDGNDLDLGNGVLTDGYLSVVHSPIPAVAVGDVARHPNALFPGEPLRIEHWSMPTDMGKLAGKTLAALLAGKKPEGSPFTSLPSFWSDQYTWNIQSFGIPGAASEYRLVEGTYDGDCIVEYHDSSGLIGVIGVNRTAELLPYRRRLLARYS
ncbi:MAG: FAD-dependent oxidoreductase [Candidatus Nanopelagicales bacterium]|nr:FAD-dependent oxidoreductase [Candidatus Nanopelagicales bacterium]MCF8538411.1 FAD-dependent oxidoreductase [Candidatus Nanopelagicales bacterium]MCF8542885.1 FAD-dependent oxidoreductase [Candidatus Nanopelagicales bacterium]MCF8558143.1 FAD-dependent oxidoreductase [Candidatus Nanopelagicales bacterium]